MTLLILELLGDATTAAEATYTIGTDISFTTATLRAIDVHAPGAMLTELWNKAQTGDLFGTSRDVSSTLYIDLDGLIDDNAVVFLSNESGGLPPRTLIPLGDAIAAKNSLRPLNLPIASGQFTLGVGSTITAKLYHRSVEGGTLGDIVPVGATVLDEDGNLASTGPWSKDARCTLYIDLQ